MAADRITRPGDFRQAPAASPWNEIPLQSSHVNPHHGMQRGYLLTDRLLEGPNMTNEAVERMGRVRLKR